MDKIEALADLMRTARSAIAFTGAGISTESGIPDFRSPNGIWARHKPVMYEDFMRDRGLRVQAWKLAAHMFRECAMAEPNEAHVAIAELEWCGHVAAVVTQNVDGLHQAAGSRNVIELHGYNRLCACQHCGHEWPTPEIVARWEAGEEAPACEHCGGPIKTRTISFGQAMPVEEMQRAAEATLAADLFIAIGSSLVVEPAASFPRMAKEAGAALVILNAEPTPLDGIADLVLRGRIGETMRGVMAHMSEPKAG